MGVYVKMKTSCQNCFSSYQCAVLVGPVPVPGVVVCRGRVVVPLVGSRGSGCGPPITFRTERTYVALPDPHLEVSVDADVVALIDGKGRSKRPRSSPAGLRSPALR